MPGEIPRRKREIRRGPSVPADEMLLYRERSCLVSPLSPSQLRLLRWVGILMCVCAILLKGRYPGGYLIIGAVAGALLIFWCNWMTWRRRKKRRDGSIR